ncbi:MAG: folylpolyglutamate synthase/dihydrofolate synthase family protein, partial [Planctomycetota bacterium]
KLDRIRRLLDHLGNPHREYRSIHIAGTKGKGSTAALLERCLREAGQTTGLFTSPHLLTPRERVRVDGEPIPEDDFRRVLGAMEDYISARRREDEGKPPTYFEILTALGLEHFRRRGVDRACVEVGLGGRLDSTNVLEPEVCVITSIGYDHQDKLGETIGEIAGEKAGILKPGVPAVLAHQRYRAAAEVVRRKADEVGCPLVEVDRDVEILDRRPLTLSDHGTPGWRFVLQIGTREPRAFSIQLPGAHQVDNAATAAAVLDVLRSRESLDISDEHIERGLERVRCAGRVEFIEGEPPVVLDAAHTVESVRSLASALRTHFAERRPWLVFGCAADKDLRGMMAELTDLCARFTAVRADSPRAADAGEVAEAAREAGLANVDAADSVAEGLRRALKECPPDGLVCVAGSFYVAGEARRALDRT